jgi:prephenate dehydrogenase
MTAAVGLIGFGRFGRLAARHLCGALRVRVFDPSAAAGEIAALGAEPADLPSAARCDAVILAVPISAMEAALAALKPHLRPGALVADVCSVKELPVRWMEALLPPAVEILGTHPMFGPDSAADSLAGRKIVLCPVRIAADRLAAVEAELAARGLEVIEARPEEHDRQIAVSLALTHFIGRGLEQFGAAPLPIDTEGYRRLLAILGVVTHDSWQLFEDMHHFNRFAPGIRRRILRALKRVDDLLPPGVR